MEFEKLIEQRRSIRSYSGEEVLREDLLKIFEQAQQAPSWKNLQTSRFHVAKTKDIRELIRNGALPTFNHNNSENAVLIISTYVKGISGFDKDGQPMNELGDKWGVYDLGLHDAYLILAAKNAGYDTLIMGIRDSEKIREILDIPAQEEIVSVIALGKSAASATPSKKKDISEVVKVF